MEEYSLQYILSLFVSSFQSKHTQQAYHKDIKDFLSFYEENFQITISSLDQITEKHLVFWQKSLHSLSSKTTARKLSSLSSFFKFAQKRKLINSNLCELLLRPKQSTSHATNILSMNEVLHILNTLEYNVQSYNKISTQKKFHLWLTRYTIMYILFSVGLRVEELCQLKIKDLEINPQFSSLHLFAKGAENYKPIINDKTANVLLNYISILKKNCKKDDFIFTGKNALAMTRQNIYKIVKISAKEAKIEQKISPHSCRATLATLLAKNGVQIGHIQTLLNHKRMSTTAIYIKKSQEESQNTALKNPFFKDE